MKLAHAISKALPVKTEVGGRKLKFAREQLRISNSEFPLVLSPCSTAKQVFQQRLVELHAGIQRNVVKTTRVALLRK